MIPAYTYEFNFSVPIFTGGRLTAERRRAQAVLLLKIMIGVLFMTAVTVAVALALH